ncbi:MAG: recombinase family protein [Terriglobia bacterium]
MKAAIYVRVSTQDQHAENQLEQLRAFVLEQGWQPHHLYRDEDSGANPSRKAFLDLMRGASDREFDVVIFWSLDRFTREGTLATLQYLNQLSTCGVGFRSFTEPYLDSCGFFKDAIISILACIAKQERVRIRERVNAGLARARAQGKKLGRPNLYLKPEAEYEILHLRDVGRSWRFICAETGIHPTTARRIYKRLAKNL